jgi:predicted permease
MAERVVRHLRHAARQIARTPVVTLTAIVSLAVGIGANTAVFTVANAVLLAPTAGVTDLSRVVDIGRTVDGRGFDTVSYVLYTDLRDQTDVFDGMFALDVEPRVLALGGADGAERIYGEEVSASFFDVLGVAPAAGTFFRTGEERLGVALRKVVLAHAFWPRRFQRDPTVVGRSIVLNGDPFTVVGVAAEGFRGTTVLAPDLWLPLTSYARATATESQFRSRESFWLTMGARLKPGVSVAQAQDAVNRVMRTVTDTYPDLYRRHGLAVAPTSRVPGQAGDFAVPFISVLMGLVGLVLLVACTNLAGVLLSRAASRSREIALRVALGASRSTIVAMLLSETLLLFVIGAGAAILLSQWMTAGIVSAVSLLPVPVALDLGVDWRVLAFTGALALVTGVVTGLTPALQSARTDLVSDLKGDAGSHRRQRLRQVFTAAQVAFCLVLLAMGGLLLRALSTATGASPGFDVDGIDVASVDLSLGASALERAPAIAGDLRERFATIPGVQSVGIARVVPLEGTGLGLGGLRRPDAADSSGGIDADWNVVSPGFFETVRMPIVSGRAFSPADRHGAPLAAVVNEQFARGVWPGQSPIGQALENGDFRPGREETRRRLTVVGIVKDARYRWLGDRPRAFIFVPLAQQPSQRLSFFLRHDGTNAKSIDVQAAVRRSLAAVDRNLPLVRYTPFRQYADLGLLPQRTAASVAGWLGVVALILAAMGVYGVMALAVASRTREFGVRMALGADRGRLVRSVLARGLRLTALGGLVGLAAALGLSQLLGDLLFGISPVDPIAFGGTLAALVAVTLAASWLPARRAARIDPVVALRAE